jgi:chromosome segregation ATPase
MMDILILILVALLAAGCGYLGGRWYAAHKQAYLQAKLDSDTENFIAMLEERNQDYVRQKDQINKARNQCRDALTERDQALAKIELEREKPIQLQQQIDQLNDKQQRMRDRFGEMETSCSQFRDTKLTLEADVKKLNQRSQELSNRNDYIEQKFNGALVDKTRLQTSMAAKDKEFQGLRQQLIQQQDLYQSTELTLAQMRNNRDELTQQLAHARGQLAMTETLKQPA